MLLAFYRGWVVRTKRICRFFNALQLLKKKKKKNNKKKKKKKKKKKQQQKKKQQNRLVPIQPLWKTSKILQWIVKDVFEIDVLYRQLYEVNMATDILMYTYLGAMAAYEFPQCCVLAIDRASIFSLSRWPPVSLQPGVFLLRDANALGSISIKLWICSRPLLDRPLHF